MFETFAFYLPSVQNPLAFFVLCAHVLYRGCKLSLIRTEIHMLHTDQICGGVCEIALQQPVSFYVAAESFLRSRQKQNPTLAGGSRGSTHVSLCEITHYYI